jgi:carnitine O-acetyltransferase
MNEHSAVNRKNFKEINESLFVLCLDDFTNSLDNDKFHHQIFHNNDASNRFFDKGVQIIVSNNGRVGINGEHSPVDAVIPGTVFDFVAAK